MANNINYIVYIRDNLTPAVRKSIANWDLYSIVSNLNIPVGVVKKYSNDVVTVTSTNNIVGASIKLVLAQWCIVESFVENHPKINPNLGEPVQGG